MLSYSLIVKVTPPTELELSHSITLASIAHNIYNSCLMFETSGIKPAMVFEHKN